MASPPGLKLAAVTGSAREADGHDGREGIEEMPIGVVGRKCGMTRVFTEDGATVPVTVIEALPNRVTQVKTVERDGYRALQVTSGSRKASRLSKPDGLPGRKWEMCPVKPFARSISQSAYSGLSKPSCNPTEEHRAAATSLAHCRHGSK